MSEKSVTTQDEVLATLQDRHKRYGTFMDQARCVQNLRAFFREQPKWNDLAHDQKEALEVIAQKISRILGGDPDYDDNWHDIAGYARLVEKRLKGEAL